MGMMACEVRLFKDRFTNGLVVRSPSLRVYYEMLTHLSNLATNDQVQIVDKKEPIIVLSKTIT